MIWLILFLFSSALSRGSVLLSCLTVRTWPLCCCPPHRCPWNSRFFPGFCGLCSSLLFLCWFDDPPCLCSEAKCGHSTGNPRVFLGPPVRVWVYVGTGMGTITLVTLPHHHQPWQLPPITTFITHKQGSVKGNGSSGDTRGCRRDGAMTAIPPKWYVISTF